jgi:nucleoside diphosphate kinase
MKSKLIPIAYTVAVVKPNLAMKADKMEEIMKIIDDNDFEVFHQKQKVLKNEEILNLFYKYRNKEFYDDIKEYLSAGESKVLLLINKVETKYDEEIEEDVKLDDPITRWKKLIGPFDPEVAKTEDENCLRSLYGVDLIRNGFHGSDDPRSANKERDVFKFSIPEKIPEFKYERYKVTVEHLLKFCYPPNLEHSNVTGRLDLFALYGPTVAYHSVDC